MEEVLPAWTDENFNEKMMGLLDSIYVNKLAMMQRSKLRI